MAHFADRIRDHKERKERLESAAEGARAVLAQRRAVLDDVKTITAYAQDMNRFLQKSELTERRAFIETFVKEIELLPDNAVVRYSVPMPDDSLIPGKKVQEIPLNGSVVSSVNGSPPEKTRTDHSGRGGSPSRGFAHRHREGRWRIQYPPRTKRSLQPGVMNSVSLEFVS